MTDREQDTEPRKCFVWLFAAVVLLLASYPYFEDTMLGAFLGGTTSLLVLTAGVYAVRAHRKTFLLSTVLAFIALCTSVLSLIRGVRGSVWAEGSFTLFYAFTTVAVFMEVMRVKRFTRDSILGIVCVYLLIGLTFGSLYDLLETLRPGSYSMNVDIVADGQIGFRQLIFYSFMTLTTIGYGDITPVTTQAQSLSIIEGVTGVLYVAVLIARIVNAYERSDR
jgi:hypothetical protein